MKTTRTLGAILLLAASCAYAADDVPTPTTLVKVDDFPVTNLHFAIFSAQNRGAGDSNEQQIALLNELVNTFMVANSAEGRKLAQHPEIAAAMEVANARLVAQALIRDHLENAPISDDDINMVYQAEYANAPSVELKARHILLETEDDAKQVIGELDKGADFAELAKQKSTGPSSTVGGDLGWFTPDQMVAPFSEAALQLKDGAYSKTPVQTQFGWHVIKREETRSTPAPSLEMVRDEIVKELRTRSLGDFVRGLRNRTDIQVINGGAEVAD